MPPQESSRKTISRIKRKRTWALPATITTATTARYLPGHRVTELLNQLLPEPTANVIAAVAQQVNDADPTYLAVTVVAAAYWIGRERLHQATAELTIMLYKGIFQRARQEVISEAHHNGRIQICRSS